jgi:triacylglycerol lipase
MGLGATAGTGRNPPGKVKQRHARDEQYLRVGIDRRKHWPGSVGGKRPIVKLNLLKMTPIVLHHGLFGHGNWELGPWRLPYFRQIDRAIAARGYPLIISGVHPTAGVVRRARQLKETILARLAVMDKRDEKIVILAHSMGGLDARHMISHLGMADRVAALVTISCPHRGSPYADWCVEHLGRRLGGLRLMKFLGLDVQAALDVTTTMCRRFNQTTLDSPLVRYYSISAQRPEKQIPPFARHAFRMIAAAEGPNDSLVSVKSAVWGEHLATWSADHWLTINRRFAPRLGESNAIVRNWLKILDRLVADGILEAPSKESSNGRMSRA